VGSRLVTDRRTIGQLVERFDALRAFPRGVFGASCPADDGSEVLATLVYTAFSHGHQVTISTGLAGCNAVTNGDLRRTAANFENKNPVGPRLLGQLERLTAKHATGAASSTLHVTWMKGSPSPGTPAKYDKVGVIKVGPASAKNVLVLEPGTSAAASYFVPLAKWIVSTAKGWQVWAVQRRENLLDDESVLNRAKEGKATTQQVFNYYLGYLANKNVKHHFQFIPDSSVEYAKRWGMSVAVHDLHIVINAAHKLGGKVVLGGHSLGGSVVTAYATWDFGGHAGADGLAGLVFIDGGSFPAETASAASSSLAALDSSKASPWLTFGGIPSPYAGLFNATGSLGVLMAPNAPSLGQKFPLLPADLKPSVPVTNEAQYGYALNAATSPSSLLAAQAHLGKGISSHTINGYHTWDGTGALTPIKRYAAMFAGQGILSANGTEWYFPQRLTDDTGAIGNGIANPAQKVLHVDSTMGRHLPHNLLIYAFCTVLGGNGVLQAASALAQQSHIPQGNLTLVNREHSYSHNDPNGAYPKNAFFSHLIPFLKRVKRS
jgi:pimeloyl-ACP methyl ester carboxylesterase